VIKYLLFLGGVLALGNAIWVVSKWKWRLFWLALSIGQFICVATGE